MNILEEYKWLEENDRENYDKYFDLFLQDSIEKGKLVSYFYPFFQRVFAHEGYQRLKLIFDITQNYCNLELNYEHEYQLIYLQINYYYSVGDYAQVFFLISKLDKEKTPSDFLIGAYCNQINILVSLRMFEEAYECAAEIFDAPYFVAGNNYSKGIFYLNAIPLTVKKKDVAKTRRYLDLLNILLDEQNILGDGRYVITSIIEYYADILLVNDKLVEGNLEELSKEFYQFIMETNLFTNALTFDSDTFITIFEIAEQYYDSKMLFDICQKVISDTKPVHRDLIDFYNFLHMRKNKYFMNDESLQKAHLDALYNQYVDSRMNNTNTLKETLRLQLLEQKYNTLEAKYNLDTLTSCFNRNYLVEIENKSINNASICYIDLDELKQINDGFGHKNGDIYLKIFSTLLLKAFKTGLNQIFRFGGDEFVIITYNEPRESVLKRVDNLYELANTTSMPNVDLEHIGFSCGVYFIEEEIIIKDAMALADKAMYACKTARKTNSECHYIIYE